MSEVIGVQAIAAGVSHTCALMKTGGVRCWGKDSMAQLGDGEHLDRALPPPSDVLTGASAISAGMEHTCALMASGGVRCWGSNDLGQLGLALPDHSRPQTVAGICRPAGP
jgi:alpha-tubulin suppressor-like RCC1 family protein